VTVNNTGTALLGTLAAQDFGSVNYDSGLGILKGYTAGFGVTDATFASSTSVVVQLFSGETLLQTNTATPKFGATITGTQFSSPFDIFGNFDYVTDGYWTNVRAPGFCQFSIPTRVVATVILANGKVVTATNVTLTGDPTIIGAGVGGACPVVIIPVVSSDGGHGGGGGYLPGFGPFGRTFITTTTNGGQVLGASIFNFLHRFIRQGDRNDDVTALQQFLIRRNAGPAARNLARVGATGFFGGLTRASLLEYQRVNHLRPTTGTVYPNLAAFIAGLISAGL
jgi:hypothetical protein